MIEGIEFKAILNKVQSTTDGGWRITLDVSDDEAEKVLEMNKHRRDILQVAVIPIPRRFSGLREEDAQP